jgi:hypothetical protein
MCTRSEDPGQKSAHNEGAAAMAWLQGANGAGCERSQHHLRKGSAWCVKRLAEFPEANRSVMKSAENG